MSRFGDSHGCRKVNRGYRQNGSCCDYHQPERGCIDTAFFVVSALSMSRIERTNGEFRDPYPAGKLGR